MTKRDSRYIEKLPSIEAHKRAYPLRTLAMKGPFSDRDEGFVLVMADFPSNACDMKPDCLSV
jgi:hypothetical protein